MPVHFRDYYARVSGRTRDYEKLSQSKVPLAGREVNLIDDFRPVQREAWANKYISIGRARLLMDTQAAWY